MAAAMLSKENVIADSGTRVFLCLLALPIHEEFIHASAPLVDVSMTLDKLKKKAGSGKAGRIIGFMDDKVKRALEPLKECVDS